MVRSDSPVLRATVRSSWSWVMGVSFLGSTVDVAPPGLLSLAAPNWVGMRIPGIGDAGAPDACSACGGREVCLWSRPADGRDASRATGLIGVAQDGVTSQ